RRDQRDRHRRARRLPDRRVDTGLAGRRRPAARRHPAHGRTHHAGDSRLRAGDARRQRPHPGEQHDAGQYGRRPAAGRFPVAQACQPGHTFTRNQVEETGGTSMRVALTTRVAAAIGTAAALALSSAAWAQKLPEQLTWTAYDVGSGGYNQAVAIGNALKNKMGITLRVLPGKNDVSRTVPLREGKVPFSANGVGGTYMVQEGMYEFGAKDWGPQPVRSILLNNSDALLTVVAAGDIGVKTMADLKGKRVAWVVGAPSLNQNITALLAFANLTWADVQKVEFGGFGQAMDGIINNQVDAAFTSTISGKAFQIETSPRKIAWPTVPHNDTEGWKRLKAKAPFYVPFMGTEGAGLSKDKPVEGATYPYPVLMTYANVDAGMVYAMTKAMVEL